MPERAGIRKEFTQSFLLDEAKLRKICDVLQVHAAKLASPTYLKFYVEREDDSFYETRDIDIVLGDDNVEAKALRTVSIELNTETEAGLFDPKKIEGERELPLAYVGFSKKKAAKALFFVTTETREWCFLLADELETQLKRTLRKDPLPFLEHTTIDVIVGVVIFLLALFFLPDVFFRTPEFAITPEQISQMTQEDAVHKTLEVVVAKRNSSAGPFFLLFVSLVALLVILEKIPTPSKILARCCQPVFYWGDAIQRHDAFAELLNKVKWGLLVAFGVSVIASIVGAIIMSR